MVGFVALDIHSSTYLLSNPQARSLLGTTRPVPLFFSRNHVRVSNYLIKGSWQPTQISYKAEANL